MEESTQKNLNPVKFKMLENTERSLEEEKRILIVDDQGFNIDAALIILKYCIKLKDCDKICDFASDGLKAFKKVKENIRKNNGSKTTYDLIMMDCNMPFMDGYEASNKIRRYLQELNLGQPVILAVTGHTEEEYVQRAIDSGMNQVLSKPLQADVLESILS